MSSPLPRALAAVTAGSLLAPALTSDAHADGECRVIEVEMTPSADLQLVAWIESAGGEYVDTIYITRATGTFGLGNRPGLLGLNSGPAWPYGRREQVFPVWAHRHGLTFPRIGFQNGDEDNLSHPFDESSRENYYCRPIAPTEPEWDATTCASNVYTDKGVAGAVDSLYPPRADLVLDAGRDHPSVETFASLNPFDAVSRATPAGGEPVGLTWAIPRDLPNGSYVLHVEVAKEFDMNATYNEETYPPLEGIPWDDYGVAYRGQPSVVYAVPFEVGDAPNSSQVADYVGYGDPDGQDGTLRAPDDTIDVDVPGSGGARLQLESGDDGMYRVRLVARPEFDPASPGGASELTVVDVDHESAQLSFVAPGDDDDVGTVAGYEIRVRADEPITEANFASAMPLAATVTPDEAGQVQLFDVTGLLPQTTYYVGIRAFDDCRNQGPLVTLELRTTERLSGEVDACFVATAAYGSPMAGDVELLRHFRDAILQETVLGELLVEAYYTFGPVLAGVIGESELLRATAREALAPVVEQVRDVAVSE